MSNRVAALLIVVLFCAGWPSTNLGGGVAASGGGGGSCSGVYCMDFDAAGCNDSGVDSCSLAGTASANCDTGQCPLTGTYSGITQGESDAIYDDSLSITSGTTTLDFTFNLAADDNTGGSGGDMPRVVGLATGGGATPTWACVVFLEASWPRIGAANGDGARSGNMVVLTRQQKYWIRISYVRADDDCTITVWDDAFDGNQIGTDTEARGTTPRDIVGFAVYGSSASGNSGSGTPDLARYVVDDITIANTP